MGDPRRSRGVLGRRRGLVGETWFPPRDGAGGGGREMKHVLVIANETVAGRSLIEALERRANGDLLVTVICPVNQPREGYVVYEDTRRAAAGRRLDRTLEALRAEGIQA